MNSLQQELDNIYKQLEHLEFRKNQLEPIIAEYSDVIERVKSLTDSMIALNIEPTNLRYDIEDILNGDDAGEWVTEADPFKPEATPEPAKDWVDEWVEVSLAAHNEDGEVETSNHSIINSYIIPFDPAVHGDDEPLEQSLEEPEPQLEAELRYGIDRYGEETWRIEKIYDGMVRSVSQPLFTGIKSSEIKFDLFEFSKLGRVQFETVEQAVEAFNAKAVEPKPTPQPEPVVKMFAFVPVPTLTPSPTPEPTPTPEKIQLNDRAFRQCDDVLLLGFTNKRLMNAWAKWFKGNWGDRIHTSEVSNNLDNFNYCLTVLWYGQADWERLTGLDYSVKPTEQNKKN